MKISNLNEAEGLVEKDDRLSWDGWDIVCFIQDDYAEFLSIGFFDKNSQSWYKRYVFKCKEDGWDLPDWLSQ